VRAASFARSHLPVSTVPMGHSWAGVDGERYPFRGTTISKSLMGYDEQG